MLPKQVGTEGRVYASELTGHSWVRGTEGSNRMEERGREIPWRLGGQGFWVV